MAEAAAVARSGFFKCSWYEIVGVSRSNTEFVHPRACMVIHDHNQWSDRIHSVHVN